MKLTAKQNEYIREAHARWNLKIGAVRSGKSYVDIAAVIPAHLRRLREKDGLNVIIGVSKETVERNVLYPMREIYTSAVVGTINSRNIAIVCGVPVYCLGAEKASQIAKIQGSSIKYCYGDEIAKWHEGVFNILKSRLDKPYSRFDGACNPEHPGHWLKRFIDDAELSAYIQHYTIFDNPHLSKDFVDNLCLEYRGTVFYDRLILGKWTLAEGLIYPMYAEAVGEPPKGEAAEYVVSIDYGTQNAFAALMWERHGNVWYAVREYYYSGRDEKAQKTDEDYAQDIDEFARVEGLTEPLRVIIDPSAASFIALLRQKRRNDGRRYKVIPADNAVLDGIRETATAMQSGKIKISPSCRSWRGEASGYVWDVKAKDDRPIKANDHCLTGDTVVMTEHGEKRISELIGKTGNVWSYNTETGKAELKPFRDCRMTQADAEIYEIETDDGRKIRCTGEHLMLTQTGWKEARHLTETDHILEVKP